MSAVRIVLVCALAAGIAVLAPRVAVTTAAQGSDKPPATEYGYAHHAPIVGAACRICPWGALADIIQEAMEKTAWRIAVCHTCAGSMREVINVETKFNPASVPHDTSHYAAFGIPATAVDYLVPPPPNGPVDFGVTTPNMLWWAYQGTQAKVGPSGKADAPPYKDLRLVATIVSPEYLIVAATAHSGITDLSDVAARVKEGRAVHVLWDFGLLNAAAPDILAYYGLSEAAITAAGGSVVFPIQPDTRKNFDVVIYSGDLSEAPEYNVWYQISQQFDLTYLELPPPLRAKLSKDYDMVPLRIPTGFLKGIWRPIPTVGYIGNSVYGRADMPDAFAYDLAKAIDEHKELLETGYEHFAYDPAQVWKAYGVPLAPGAKRYYEETGYLLKGQAVATP